jgi:hypothetical protein
LKDPEGSPSARAKRVRVSLETKVALLERFAADGAPPGLHWPKTMREVAAWTSPQHGFAAWSKPNILSPAGPYPELRRRLDAAISTLVAQEAGRGKVRDTALQIRALTRERDALAAQVLRLLDQVATLRRDGQIARAKISSPEAR